MPTIARVIQHPSDIPYVIGSTTVATIALAVGVGIGLIGSVYGALNGSLRTALPGIGLVILGSGALYMSQTGAASDSSGWFFAGGALLVCVVGLVVGYVSTGPEWIGQLP